MTGRTATASLTSLPYTSLRTARVNQLTSASAGACTAIASREYWRQPITMPIMTTIRTIREIATSGIGGASGGIASTTGASQTAIQPPIAITLSSSVSAGTT